MDSLVITREEFRLEMHKLLEFLAQGLGGVPGTFTNENVDPLALLLAGAPKLLTTAIPPAADNSQRLPSTSWVKALLDAWGKDRTFLREKSVRTSFGGVTIDDTTLQFNCPAPGGAPSPHAFQLCFGALGPTDATGQLFWTWTSPFAANPIVVASAPLTAAPAANLAVVTHVQEAGMTTCRAANRYISGTGAPTPQPGATVHYFAFGPAASLIP